MSGVAAGYLGLHVGVDSIDAICSVMFGLVAVIGPVSIFMEKLNVLFFGFG